MNPSRHIRSPRVLSAALAIAGFAALAMVGFAKSNAAAPTGYKNAGPTTVKISQNAQLIASFQINVQVTLSCSTGSAYFVSVNVQQPRGFGQTTSGSGYTSGQCSGAQQKLVVSVYSFFGPDQWQLGDAVASASACTAACGTDTKQIHIVS
jgi:hypothetical protein